MTHLKKSLFAATAALALSASVQAENIFLDTPESFQVLALSPNGKWAAGVYVDAVQESYAFRWNLESGSIEMLGNQPSIGWDVANDGTVSGEFGGVAYWRDGEWHRVELPTNYAGDYIGSGISPDGHYMTGSIFVRVPGYDYPQYVPYIWKDGKILRALGDGVTQGVPSAVSPDGTMATGWTQKYNRTACVWGEGSKVTTFEDSPEYSMSPWNYGRNFSPDGTKVVYWGGWDPTFKDGKVDQNYLWCLYDVQTGERTKVKAPAPESDLEFFDVSNSGLMVGLDRGRGYVQTSPEVGMYIDEYLAMRGVDASKFDGFYRGDDYYVDQLPINRVISISEDENVIALNYYDTLGQPRSLVIKIDQDPNSVQAAEVKGQQLAGINSVVLTWKRPAGVNSVRGYYVYRDGQKISGFMPINVPYFYDRNLALGTYTYQIGTVVSNGTENRSETFTVDVTTADVESPVLLFGRQKGISSAQLSWNEPAANIVHKRYFDPNRSNLQPLSIYEDLTVEMAIRFDKQELACYPGHKITEVSFMPMAAQKSWSINIYTTGSNGQLELLASQPVTQELTYKKVNTVRLNTPLDLPAGDLYVAVEADVDAESGTVLGSETDAVVAGYSDLLRRKGIDEQFMSTYESSAEGGMTISTLSWAIDLGLTPDSYDAGGNALVSYCIYENVDGADIEIDSATATKHVLAGCADGFHKYGVAAVYASGAVSEPIYTTVRIQQALNPIAITDLATTDLEVTASWEAPMDDDLTTVTYTPDKKHTNGVRGTEDNAWAVMVAHRYPASMFQSYEGYTVRHLRFYPLADALFTLMLYENNKLVAEVEVEDFTIGEWNDVELPAPVKITPGAEYMLVLDCFDPEPDVPVIAIDGYPAMEYMSDLFSTDNGQNWRSFNYDVYGTGSFMLGMNIFDEECADQPAIDGYDVVIDDEIVNESSLPGTTNQYTYTFAENDNARHSIHIDAYYPGKAEAVVGATARFRLVPAGLETNVVADVTLTQTGNKLVAEGEGITALEVYSASGAMVASAQGNTVEIDTLSAGTYAVRILTANGSAVRKVNIR